MTASNLFQSLLGEQVIVPMPRGAVLTGEIMAVYLNGQGLMVGVVDATGRYVGALMYRCRLVRKEE